MRHTVSAPGTLGDCLTRLLSASSGRTRKQMLATGRVLVNDAIARSSGTPLRAGDVVAIAPKTVRSTLPPGLSLVHEDVDVLVVDKPAGLLTIATERERTHTVYVHLMAHARARRPPARVFVVHRLDREASGLLVFATLPGAKTALQAQFAAHTVERIYLAVVEGRPAEPAGTIVGRLLEDGPGRVRVTTRPGRGRAAVTRWRVCRAGERYSLLEVQLETGRRNQIRVHLARIGHPIAGDAAYGSRIDPLRRLALHAHVLGFDHPRTGNRLRFVSPAPGAFAKLAT